MFSIERRIHIAKFLADISKVVIAAGTVGIIFSPQRLEWHQFFWGLLFSSTLFIMSLVIYPKEK